MTDRDSRSGPDVYAAEQGAAHRRGFVLGLTLAESILLLTFVVLLLLVVGFARRDDDRERLRDEVESLTASLATWRELEPLLAVEGLDRLKEDVRVLAELKKVAQEKGLDWDSSFLELVRAELRGSHPDTVEAARRLAEKEARLSEALERVGAGAEPAELLTETTSRLAESEGRVREMSRRIGGDLPSCWRTADDRPEFVLDAVLETDGIRIRERPPAARLSELRSLMGNVPVDPAQVLTKEQFVSRTSELFEFSRRNECRFFVVVYDATGESDKERYKSLLQVVENHFYKRLDRGRAAF